MLFAFQVKNVYVCVYVCMYIKEQQHPNNKARRLIFHSCNKKGSKIKYILLIFFFLYSPCILNYSKGFGAFLHG